MDEFCVPMVVHLLQC